MRFCLWTVWHNAQSTFKQSVVICAYSSASTIYFALLTAYRENRKLICYSQSDNDKIWISTEQCSKVGAFEEFVSDVCDVCWKHFISNELSLVFIAIATKFNFLVPKTCGFHFETIILVDALSRTPYTSIYRIPHHTPRYSISFINSIELIMD